MRNLLMLGLIVFLGTLGMSALAEETSEISRPDLPGPLRFYASFDKDMKADLAFAEDKGIYRRYRDFARGQWQLVPGRFGKALATNGITVRYYLSGSVNIHHSSISFWFRLPPDFEKGLQEILAVSTASNDFRISNYMRLRLSNSGDINVVFYDRLRQSHGLSSKAPEIKPGEWHHFALVWDASQGMKVYFDGKEVGSNWGEVAWHPGMVATGRLCLGGGGQKGTAANIAYDEIKIFSLPLNARAIEALYLNRELPEDPAVPMEASFEYRLEEFSWAARGGEGIIEAGPDKPLLITCLPVEAAWAYKKDGWRGVDGRLDSSWPLIYHPYIYLEGGGLHIHFADKGGFNYFSIAGNFYGSLYHGGAKEPPAGEKRLLKIDQDKYREFWKFDEKVKEDAVSFFIPQGKRPLVLGRYRAEDEAETEEELRKKEASRIYDAAFYRVKPLGDAIELPEGSRAFYLSGVGEISDPKALAVLVSDFRESDQGALLATAEMHVRHPKSDIRRLWKISPLTRYHIFTPPAEADFPLGRVALRLFIKGFKKDDLLNFTIRDPFYPTRELANINLKLSAPADLEQIWKLVLDIDLPDLIVPQGRQVWITLTSRSGGYIIQDVENHYCSSVILIPAEKDKALKSFVETQWRLLRDNFEAISEPRPWGKQAEDDSALRGGLPVYDDLAGWVNEILRLAPDEPRARAVYAFLHPRIPHQGDVVEIPQPPEGVPKWAFLARENFRLSKYFADWWVDNRLAPTGELGSFYGDDTDLVNDWVDLALISDPGNKLKRNVLRLADFCYDDGRIMRRREIEREGERVVAYEPSPIIKDGLNVRITDALHAYEEGINAGCLAFILDYGNPIAAERLMATCRYYDDYLTFKRPDGRRFFRGGVYGYSEVREGQDYYTNSLMLQPGLLLMWYNGNPTATKIIGEWCEAWISVWQEAEKKGGPYATHINPRTLEPISTRSSPRLYGYGMGNVFFGVYMATRDKKYFWPVDLVARRDGTAYWPEWRSVLDLRQYDEGTLAGAAEEKFETLGTQNLGWGDLRYRKKYAAWMITRDKNHLLEALEAVYRRQKLIMPAYTVAGQSGDRVAVPKNLIDRIYLGGMAAARNMIYPYFAVSYEGLDDNFAALVLVSKPDHLKVLLYNFSDAPQEGLLRVWELGNGRYKVTAGPDANADDEMDEAESSQELALKRYEAIPISLPPRCLWVIEAEQISKGAAIHTLPDLAVCAKDMKYDAKSDVLEVKIHSIGAKATGPYTVTIVDQNGRKFFSKDMPGLGAPIDFNPRIAKIEVPGLKTKGISKVFVLVKGGKEEITKTNNKATINVARLTSHVSRRGS